MKILIIEDEPPIALSIKESCKIILKDKNPEFIMTYTLSDAITIIEKENVDLCLLDLNLNGQNGFNLLKKFTSGFYTIIISAYSEKAIEAYEYGVIDFVPKPFHIDRLEKAFNRFFKRSHNFSSKAQYLSIHKQNENHLIPVSDICYFKAVRYIIEIHLLSKKKELIEKPLNQLEEILPSTFIRIHRSYIVDFNQIKSIKHNMGGQYQIILKNGDILPISRKKFKIIKDRLL